MKKSSLQTKGSFRHRALRTNKLRLIFFALALIVLGWLLPGVVSLVSTTVLSPAHKVAQWFHESPSAIPFYFRERARLQEEIEALKIDQAKTSGTELTVQKLLEENIQLRMLLSDTVPPRVAARVTARPNSLPYDVIQIDKGEQAGIVVGAPVFYGRDIALGLVAHVGPTYAFVKLFSTAGTEATVFVVGPNVFTTMEGVGGGVLRVRFPQGVPIAVGNQVVLSAIDSGVLGTISYIESTPTQPLQYGYVVPFVPLQSLRYVSVGTTAFESPVVPNVTELIARFSPPSLLVPEVAIATTTIATSTATTTP